ncbi:hypothetical protein GCM10023193_24380 [Planotetraspora kaengkrachanensis]|uniref:Uncharacterized protein n=1 Tax=Planotetraspora kaengkrachanensis TaxID=575193 RepID=A0A8J3M369_9ACTN|nr:hypothetical protein Pka01_16610 [Planotetraspora kaengkrachanensis]
MKAFLAALLAVLLPTPSSRPLTVVVSAVGLGERPALVAPFTLVALDVLAAVLELFLDLVLGPVRGMVSVVVMVDSLSRGVRADGGARVGPVLGSVRIRPAVDARLCGRLHPRLWVVIGIAVRRRAPAGMPRPPLA